MKKTDELRAKRAQLARIQLKEYQTRGNTQHCQELWSEILKIDAEIDKAAKEEV